MGCGEGARTWPDGKGSEAPEKGALENDRGLRHLGVKERHSSLPTFCEEDPSFKDGRDPLRLWKLGIRVDWERPM